MPIQVSAILQFLVNCGLCTDSDGQFRLGTQTTILPSHSPFIKQHRLNWHLKAMERASHLSDDELMFSSPVSLSEKDFQRLREEMVSLIKRFYETAKTSDAERLACSNIDWVFITK
jgi:hypothetical protein